MSAATDERIAAALERLADTAILAALYKWAPANEENDEARRLVVKRLHQRELEAADDA